MTRKSFIEKAAGAFGFLLADSVFAQAGIENDLLAVGQRETDCVTPEIYRRYLQDGKTGGFAALEKLEDGFQKVLSETETVRVDEIPAVWLVYNMGVVVKTRESLFAIDLVHRRARELAPRLDFALVTHNHGDHHDSELYRAMNASGKTVVNNFIDNYGAADWTKGGGCWYEHGGYMRGEKVFRIKDVEIRTSLTDHNDYLVDYTTAFEIRVGSWRMYHTGDCSNVAKLNPVWGSPDLWVVFPGCGIDLSAGVRKIRPKRLAFGHLWELAHATGRLTAPSVRQSLNVAAEACGSVTVPLWGDRIV